MTAIRDIETIVAGGLCAGCGLCESIAGRDRVEMGITSAGQIRPHVKQAPGAEALERILAVCPGIAVTGPDPAQAGPAGVMHEVWGPIRTLQLGWSADAGQRFRSAAGGAMTELGAYLLQTGQVDAVVHVRASETEPMLTDALVSRTVEEVRSGAQSRYGPAAPLRHVMELIGQGLRLAVLAKPCDIAAMRNLQRTDPRAEAQVRFLVTLFCGGVPTVHTARRIAAYQGVQEDELRVFRWRGNGWPGPTHIETKDGRSLDMTYDDVWYRTDVPWTYDIQFRCKICPDAIGELADVACPDGWVMENGRPIHREADGMNVLVARTERGEKLVAEAVAAGALQVAPFTLEELDAMHGDHRPRKTEWPSRVKALEEEGEPTPRYDRLRARAMTALLGPEGASEALEGARRRVREGAHREPLR